MNIDKLTIAANERECSKLSYIKEMVRLFNLHPSNTTLTLTAVTSHTEHYTGTEEVIPV